MKKLFYTLFLILLIFPKADAQTYTEQERNQIITEFKEHIDQSRDRISKMQDRGKLQDVQYMDEEAVIRDAEQTLELIREGNYIEKAKIDDWKSRLSKLGVSPDKEQEGVQYREKAWSEDTYKANSRSDSALTKGEDLVRASTERIENAKQKIEQQRRDGKITENEYKEKKEKLKSAERAVQRLKDNLEQHREVIAEKGEGREN